MKDIDEAIKILNEIIEEGWLISDWEKHPAIDACELAIRSLEAWQKVRAELEQTAKDYDKFDDYRRNRGLKIAIEVIDKALKEVTK